MACFACVCVFVCVYVCMGMCICTIYSKIILQFLTSGDFSNSKLNLLSNFERLQLKIITVFKNNPRKQKKN